MYIVIENPNPDKFIFPVDSDKFVIIDDNGNRDPWTFPTLERAQFRANVLNDPNAPSVEDLFFDNDTAIDYFANSGNPTVTPEVEDNDPPPEKTSFVTKERYKIGDSIQDGKYRYTALEDSHYQTADEDFPESGYWTHAKLEVSND